MRVQHQFLVTVLFVYGYVMLGREAKVSGSGCSVVPKNGRKYVKPTVKQCVFS